METHESIKRMFQLYVGKHFTRMGRAIFGKWLRAQQDQVEKEEMLQQCWEASEGEISADTWNEWNRLQEQLGISFKRNGRLGVRWMRYAAVIALFLVTVGGTYWTAVQYTLHQPTVMSEMFVPYGETRELVLPDNSRVWVNAGSTLVYPSDFSQMDSRTVYLTGEASFHVSKNKKKPFIVKTAGLDVQALGTVFTVKSYAGEDFTEATLEEGSVKVSLKEGDNRSYILEPSDQLVYSHADGGVRMNRVDIALYKMARKGYLIFENVSFEQMILTLEKKYGVTFQYNATRYGNDLYNVKFAPDETIENVMEILHQLIGIQYIINEKNVIVK
ncbi:FecR family protein [Phocaeicola barnesiae]|uniref:FecR domain-containing protein n=1 Tax=Phocaeicola barnesiae TaxID=376804 RepID=A0AAW5MXK8_9BACT|nr:FecR family protein [Phocaeicola barnesiae]MCR8873048.1 FecR domain-containing protein [Phocaeicola barnesiae]